MAVPEQAAQAAHPAGAARSLGARCLAAAVALGLAMSQCAAANHSVSGTAKGEFQTAAPHAILIDADSDSILFEKDADELMPPSSLAKLMTAEVVFHQIKEGRIHLEDEFTISENAWRRGGAPSHTSSMFAAIHSRVSVQDLLQGVIVQSGNDACIALAEGIAGNEPAFAAMMTKRARELGLAKSVFTNATGLPDPGLKVTARELAELARHIIQAYPEFYHFYGQREFTWNRIRQQNRNPLLAMGIGADGLKTGYTVEGGYGLVGSAVQNGLRLIVVVNGLKTAKGRAEEARKLLEWGFRTFEARLLFAEGQIVGEAKVYGGNRSYVPLVGSRAISLMVPRGTNERLLAKLVYQGPVQAPIKKGQPIGALRVFRNGSLALDLPLQAADSVGVGSVSQRAFDAATELVIDLFRAGTARL